MVIYEPMSQRDGTGRFVGVPAADTEWDAHAAQADVYRRLGGCARVDIMFRLGDALTREMWPTRPLLDP
jgi:hypothetical protein